MKKLSSLLLALVFCLSLAACGGDSAEESNPLIESGAPSSASSDVENNIQEVESTQPEDEITFNEITVVDNDECSIAITGIDPDNFWGYSLNVNLENKSSEKTYMFSVLNAAVDGVQCDPFLRPKSRLGKRQSTASLSWIQLLKKTTLALPILS